MNLKIKKLNPDAILPCYMTPGAAAMDICACTTDNITIKPGERALIKSGLSVQLEKNHVAILCSRSGLAYKNGVSLANGVGIIDSDYTGEVKIALINNSGSDFTVENGMRIAQMMIMPVSIANIIEVEQLDQTERGNGGFGSTGIKNNQ